MFALIAALIALVAWVLLVLGDGLSNPWAWLFAATFFAALHLAYPGPWPFPWHRGRP